VNIKLPTNSATLTGNVTAPDGTTITGYQWSTVISPNGATPLFSADGKEVSTTITGLTVAGAYQFKLEATASNGNKSSATVAVNVAAANVPPTANVGSNIEHDIADGNVVLNGRGTDTDGTIASYAWSLVSKPDGAVTDPATTGANTASLTITSFPKVGEYKFELVVTDNEGTPSTPSVVTVNVYRMATATISVAANSFTAGPTLNFAPVYSGWNTDFPSSSVTYTLTSDKPTKDLNSYNGIVPANIYTSMDTPIFTQIFYYNGAEVGQRSVVGFVSGTNFAGIYDSDDDDTGWNTLTTIPAVFPPLPLSKKITSE
jgi:hypothetical protein